MKALTLWQPWASLIALGVKTIETRSWSTSYRGPLAIHAAKGNCQAGQIGEFDVEKDNPRGTAPAFLLRGPIDWPYRLPLGEVVATCRLVDCVRTERIWWEPDRFEVKGRYVEWSRYAGLPDRCDARVAEEQRPYGDYSPGRWAWLLSDIVPRHQPVPARGGQGLWEWSGGDG